uniref:Secreted protein PK-4 n=1 Tax=Ornithodoros moubata TaxID=6938 RepID=Q6QVL8_ORNMO|nr:secreted protein PK-4 precursor [Ornithodoros moubata]
MTSSTLSCVFALFAVVTLTSAQFGRPNFNFKPPAPRHRFGYGIQAGGNSGKHYEVNVGARAEYDLHRFPNGAKIVGHVEGSHAFGKYEGQKWQGKPQGEVGVRVEIPFKG